MTIKRTTTITITIRTTTSTMTTTTNKLLYNDSSNNSTIGKSVKITNKEEQNKFHG